MGFSENLIIAARRQAELRGGGAAERYQELAQQFHAEAEFDAFGLRQALLEMREQPGGLLPVTKPTFRGRLGARVIRVQARFFWWLLHAIRAPERALQATYETLRYQDQRRCELESTVAQLESRIRSLEDQIRQDQIDRDRGRQV